LVYQNMAAGESKTNSADISRFFIDKLKKV
jgi:hypothetical protein